MDSQFTGFYIRRTVFLEGNNNLKIKTVSVQVFSIKIIISNRKTYI